MTILQIKRELPATRCDICHQADCFTPETGVCTRCVGISTDGSVVAPMQASRMFSNYGGSPPTWDRASLRAAFDGIPFLNRATIFYLLAALPFVGAILGTSVMVKESWLGGFIYLLSFLESFICLVWGSLELVRKGVRETEDWPALALAGFGGTFCIVAILIYLFSWAFW
jgi:hypothetical protein